MSFDIIGGLGGGGGIGSTVGSVVGTYFGPVGTAVGGVIGGFADSLLGGEQKYPNAKESADKMRSFGAPDYFVNAAINRAYGYAGPGYLSGARLLKRALADEQRDAALIADAVGQATGGQRVTDDGFWRDLVRQLSVDQPADTSGPGELPQQGPSAPPSSPAAPSSSGKAGSLLPLALLFLLRR